LVSNSFVTVIIIVRIRSSLLQFLQRFVLEIVS